MEYFIGPFVIWFLWNVINGFNSQEKPPNPHMICPHCQTKGTVTTTQVRRKAGVSGAKATAAVVTLGWSLLATGLSRKVDLTEATCRTCGSTWTF